MTKRRIRAAAIIIKDRRIALIHRLKHGEEYWVLPGGGIEPGESPQQAVIRETKEETGLDVFACQLVFFVDRFEDGIEDQPCFTCQTPGGELKFTGPEIKRGPENTCTPEWVDIQKLPDMLIYPQTAKKKLLHML